VIGRGGTQAASVVHLKPVADIRFAPELDEVKGGDLSALAADIRQKMKSVSLPPGYTWELGGQHVVHPHGHPSGVSGNRMVATQLQGDCGESLAAIRRGARSE
jgi:hypothetical protein